MASATSTGSNGPQLSSYSAICPYSTTSFIQGQVVTAKFLSVHHNVLPEGQIPTAPAVHSATPHCPNMNSNSAHPDPSDFYYSSTNINPQNFFAPFDANGHHMTGLDMHQYPPYYPGSAHHEHFLHSTPEIYTTLKLGTFGDGFNADLDMPQAHLDSYWAYRQHQNQRPIPPRHHISTGHTTDMSQNSSGSGIKKHSKFEFGSSPSMICPQATADPVVTGSPLLLVNKRDIGSDVKEFGEIKGEEPVEDQKRKSSKVFSCGSCGKEYCRKSTLKAHMKHHAGPKAFVCQICKKCFSQAANLTAHKRVHTGEKPFSCSICSRPFSQSSSLVTHKRTHTGERPYPCNHCDKAFTDSSTLTKHLRTHTGQKPYSCHLCLMRFSQSGNLHRHMKTHVGETDDK
ncbi:zinc-finger double domain-containing protein [Ditylenchus destructor]|uniref:Zinc-finger double domain-containing protein n=1 Tax=Ditylenchus destructor TaxID=166010 RepID=A0AAD4N706_9BILA|nr:zinc-finger double domain-containing protein [Ditylenchus destructor]